MDRYEAFVWDANDIYKYDSIYGPLAFENAVKNESSSIKSYGKSMGTCNETESTDDPVCFKGAVQIINRLTSGQLLMVWDSKLNCWW